MKVLFSTIILLMTLSVSADADIKGEWCREYGSFSDILILDGSGSYWSGLVDANVLDVLFPLKGTIFNGENGAGMVPSIQDEIKKLTDVQTVQTGLLGKKLKLSFSDETVLVYRACLGAERVLVKKLRGFFQQHKYN